MSSELEQRGRLIGLGLLNNASAAVALVTGLVMVPIMLAGLGSTAYGLWIMVISISGLVMSLDLGLSLIITREVARTSGERSADASAAARSAGGALLLVGAGGLVAMSTIGLVAGLHDELPDGIGRAGFAVFALVGLALLMEQATQYCIAVLGGRLHYGLANAVVSGSILLRASLVFMALSLGTGLSGVAVANASGATLTAILGALAVKRVDPRHSLGQVTLQLQVLRPQLRLGVASLFATAAGALLWQVHPLIVGTLAGSAAVVTFYVGMRLPMLASEMNWRTAEVLLPAVSVAADRPEQGAAAEVALSTGVRWLTLLVLPIAVMGFVLAPSILDAWLSDAPPGTGVVMRLGMIVVLLDGWSVAAMQVLWAVGRPARIVPPMVGAAALAVGLDFVLVPMIGALAAPIAMIAGLMIVAVVTLRAAAVVAEVTLPRLLVRDVAGLLPAGAACGAATMAGAWLGGEGDIPRIVFGCLSGIAAYVLVVRFTGSVAEERVLLGNGLVRLLGCMKDTLRVLRRRVRGVGALRSAWYLLLVLRRRVAYRSASTSASLDQLFDASPDPWRYDSPAERYRHSIAEDFVARIDASAALDRVLEIGCAEGAFTERLAPHCRSLLSLDVSPAALDRARRRRDWAASVAFARFDLLRDTIPGRYTAIVVMDVLTYFESVAQLRAIRAKIVDAIEPGGWLLVGDVRQSEVYETSWWGRKLLCGGLRICEFIGAHEQLGLVASADTETHVFRLLRKTM